MVHAVLHTARYSFTAAWTGKTPSRVAIPHREHACRLQLPTHLDRRYVWGRHFILLRQTAPTHSGPVSKTVTMIIASSRFRRKTPRVPGRIPNVSRRSSQSSGGWMLLLRGPACHAELPRSVAEGRICLPESTIWPGLGRLGPACSESGTQSSRVIQHRNTKQLHRCCSQRSMACGPTAWRPALVP